MDGMYKFGQSRLDVKDFQQLRWQLSWKTWDCHAVKEHTNWKRLEKLLKIQAEKYGVGATLLNGEIEKSSSASCWRRQEWEDTTGSRRNPLIPLLVGGWWWWLYKTQEEVLKNHKEPKNLKWPLMIMKMICPYTLLLDHQSITRLVQYGCPRQLYTLFCIAKRSTS